MDFELIVLRDEGFCIDCGFGIVVTGFSRTEFKVTELDEAAAFVVVGSFTCFLGGTAELATDFLTALSDSRGFTSPAFAETWVVLVNGTLGG